MSRYQFASQTKHEVHEEINTCVSCWGIVAPVGVTMVEEDGDLCTCHPRMNNEVNPILVAFREYMAEDYSIAQLREAASLWFTILTGYEWDLAPEAGQLAKTAVLGLSEAYDVQGRMVDHALMILMRLDPRDESGNALPFPFPSVLEMN